MFKEILNKFVSWFVNLVPKIERNEGIRKKKCNIIESPSDSRDLGYSAKLQFADLFFDCEYKNDFEIEGCVPMIKHQGAIGSCG